ncbi:MAG: hypothetical protein KDC24_09655 [Saprospiraceae bacterium]|nr:hypothetical protein [Saprospiraceae bacterium]
MKKIFGISILLVMAVSLVSAQTEEKKSDWLQKLEKFKIKPSLGLQLWSSYTFDQKVFNEETQSYDPVDDRLNFQLRRTRIGLKGQPYENLSFNFTIAIDLVGRDLLSGTEAGVNNGASPIFRLWNAYVQWRVLDKKEGLNVVFGYLPPQMGRESITSALRSNSMEKSWSQNYLRRHLTGIGPGRTMGVNVGGVFYKENRTVNWSYDAGIFTPQFESYGGNSVGDHFSPLLVGRLVAHIGDPEFKKYGIGHKINYFGKRNGLSLALAASNQGQTDLFESNQAIGADFLLNWGNLNFDGEWSMLTRSGYFMVGEERQNESVAAQTGYVRAGYNITLSNGWVIEPVAMWMFFNGEMGAEAQGYATQLKTMSGAEGKINVGANLYLNPDLKLSLFYTLRNGDAGDAGPGATVNNYFVQGGVGAIERGNWLGLGLVGIF